LSPVSTLTVTPCASARGRGGIPSADRGRPRSRSGSGRLVGHAVGASAALLHGHATTRRPSSFRRGHGGCGPAGPASAARPPRRAHLVQTARISSTAPLQISSGGGPLGHHHRHAAALKSNGISSTLR
jgi:hypothetical protein